MNTDTFWSSVAECLILWSRSEDNATTTFKDVLRNVWQTYCSFTARNGPELRSSANTVISEHCQKIAFKGCFTVIVCEVKLKWYNCFIVIWNFTGSSYNFSQRFSVRNRCLDGTLCHAQLQVEWIWIYNLIIIYKFSVYTRCYLK